MMNRVMKWAFDAVVPAFLAAIAVFALIEAQKAYDAAEWGVMSMKMVWGGGMFTALFMYLDWNKRNYTE